MTRRRSMDDKAQAIIADHLRRYLESGGTDGHMINGTPTLLLTTIGRRSAKPRTTPLIYGVDGDRLLLVASLGGAPEPPQWYLNVTANPAVELQVATERFSAVARTASEDEKPPLWRIMSAIYPAYDAYQARTERVLPIVILERRVGRSDPPAADPSRAADDARSER